ncbi:hypothetical protein [Desulfitobacterium dichloroeliminans]|uniref:hypothetical protein n=1 Tax=Desulfitobacterium dichloroeliminans TaxID=233055 RepID=UPI0002498507|nr:hypothetical protein [Desulfitobacterium dichloroeliminans]
MKVKWNNEFFARIGLVPAHWLHYSMQFGYTIEQYIQKMTRKAKENQDRTVQRAKERGQDVTLLTLFAKCTMLGVLHHIPKSTTKVNW